jgi:tetratricopeptide (TPR) repeat protein
MTTSVDPEDVNLNGAKLTEQNARVLAAKRAAEKREAELAGEQARKDAEDEVTLEQIARAYKGRPLPDDWDPETHPAFMEDPARQIEEGNPLAQAMDMLKIPDPPEEIAERAKQKGNHFLKRGPRYYKEAIAHYTEAIQAGGKDDAKNAIYYSNRAAVELLRKNYGKVVEDCTKAMQLNPSHIKAYFRCARAQAGLHKWQLCVDVCEAGLKIEASNKEILKELENARAKLEVRRQEAKKKEAEKAKQMMEDSKGKRALNKAIEARGIRMGECVYGGAVQGGQAQDPFVDEEGSLHWPVLFLYDEFDQSDYFQDTHEGATLQACLEMLFDPDSPPPEWDPTRRYRPGSLAVYIATNQVRVLLGALKGRGRELVRMKGGDVESGVLLRCC